MRLKQVLPLNLSLELLNGLVDITFRVLGYTEDRLPSSNAISANGADKTGTSPAVALFKLLPEGDLGGRREESKGGDSPDNSVEVDMRPDAEGFRERQDEKRCGGKAESELGDNPSHKVVVALARGRLATDRVKEERTDVATEVYCRLITATVSTSG